MSARNSSTFLTEAIFAVAFRERDIARAGVAPLHTPPGADLSCADLPPAYSPPPLAYLPPHHPPPSPHPHPATAHRLHPPPNHLRTSPARSDRPAAPPLGTARPASGPGDPGQAPPVEATKIIPTP